MAYAVNTNQTFASKAPLKTKHSQSEFVKELREYMQTHRISVQTDSSGEVSVISTERNPAVKDF